MVSKKTEVLNTLRCLDAMKDVVLKLKYFPQYFIFCRFRNFCLDLFFPKARN